MFKLSNILLSSKKAERHPFEIILMGFVYVSISLFLSFWIFPTHSSLVMVFLVVISYLYVIENVLIREEEKESDEYKDESKILKEHLKTLKFFTILFIGFLLSFLFWTLVLPEKTLAAAFSVQETTFKSIQSITGNAVIPEGTLSTILSNNLRVLFLSLLLAVFYGAGAIFILVWNASIMGFVIGTLVKKNLGLISLPYALLKYLTHGIPEMLAYFAAALAGGILFIAIARNDIKGWKAKRTLTDISILTAISVALLIIAAFIETYISPII